MVRHNVISQYMYSLTLLWIQILFKQVLTSEFFILCVKQNKCNKLHFFLDLPLYRILLLLYSHGKTDESLKAIAVTAF